MPKHPLPDALSRAATWPAEAQAELAAYAEEIEAGLADARAGRFATDEQIATVFARHRRG